MTSPRELPPSRFERMGMRGSRSSNSFLRSVTTVASGAAVAQSLPILVTPVLTRLYTASDMGKLGLYAAFLAFTATTITLGYSQAIVTGKDTEEGGLLTVISALVILPASFVVTALYMGLTWFGFLGFGELPLWTAIPMFVSLALTGLYFTFRYLMLRSGEFQTISVAAIAQSIGRVAIQIAAGVAGIGWFGLIAGEVSGRSTGLARLERATRLVVRSSWQATSLRQLWKLAVDYRKFPLLTMPSSLLNGLALVLPVPLITMYFGIVEAGVFLVASRIMAVPLSFIGTSVGDVFHNRIAILSREAPDRASMLFFKTTCALFAVGLLPTAVVIFGHGSLVALVLGPEWQESGAVAAAIAPWILIQFAVNPVSRVVLVFQGQGLKLIYDVLGLVSVVGVLSYANNRGWEFVFTCSVLGWTQAIVYVVYFVLLVRIVLRHTNVGSQRM